MTTHNALEATLGEILLRNCSLAARLEIEGEVEVIIDRYAPQADPADLRAFAEALRPTADMPSRARSRLRLWAAALRERADLVALSSQVAPP